MTAEELEREATLRAGDAWEMVKRGRMINPPETFEEMVEMAKKWVLEEEAERVDEGLSTP